CEISEATAEAIQNTRLKGGRIVAIGTTTVRTLESVAAAHEGRVAPWSGETSLFIRPPYEFRVVDVLVTNFHLPKSSLLVMVSALAGRERILKAYRCGVAEGYRFFSYGDAMLIV
ncbi:MAG: S-adenosylmethionine:tRNA ribosyltransferase-isomerase, partial [Planctomycetaceae bacterium]|nr:S-adenosylmethionine:tRNA ribosyltransferase-isomerase [Planctomycetaceae bacterium]